MESALAGLVRKEILTRDADPRSPERGQHRFVQALVRTVAYDTLSRRDRKARHLTVAGYLERTSTGDDLAPVLAQHFLDARDCLPDAADAAELGRRARDWLERAAQRAARLGAPAQALRHCEEALELASGPAETGRIAAAAAHHAYNAGAPDVAVRLATRARAAFLAAEQPLEATAVGGVLGDALSGLGRCSEAIGLLSPVLEGAGGGVADPAALAAARLPVELALARAHLWTGDWPGARRHGEAALELAEGAKDLRAVARGLAGLGAVMFSTGRPYTGLALMDEAVDLARREQLRGDEVTALNNAGVHRLLSDLPGALDRLRAGAAITAETGDRQGAVLITLNLLSGLWLHGAWDEAAAAFAAHEEAGRSTVSMEAAIDAVTALIALARGQDPPAALDRAVAAEDPIDLAFVHLHQAARAEAAGDLPRWFEQAGHSLRMMHAASGIDDDFHLALPPAVESALATGHLQAADEALALLRGEPTLAFQPYLAAQGRRLEALLEAARLGTGPAGTAPAGALEEVGARLGAAADELGRFGAPFWQARTMLDRAELLARTGDHRAAAEIAGQAQRAFAELGARPWRARAQRLLLPAEASGAPGPEPR